MKRITYISRFADGLTMDDVKKIAEISVKNNQRDGLTGVLLVSGNIFYQIIEGEESNLDNCFYRISHDPRHKDIFVLKVEENISERKYKDWAMNTVILNEGSELLTQAAFYMLDSFSESMDILKKYILENVLTDLKMGRNPILKHPTIQEYVVIFGDIYFSSTLTEKLPVEKLSEIFQLFFEITIEKIQTKGGIVSKLLGDGLMAYFPAEKANDALEALLEVMNEIKKYHTMNFEENLFSLLYAGFGLSAGKVYEGNLGSKEKLDFTILGNCVNIAARLEKATRKVKRNILFDSSVVRYLNRDDILKVAKLKLRNVSDYVDVYTLNNKATKFEFSYEEVKENILNSL